MRKQDAQHAETLAELQEVQRELSLAQGKLDALTEQEDVTYERNQLKKEVADLQLDKERIKEQCDKKVRETEHRVGLLQEKQTQDAGYAEREVKVRIAEAEVKVKQENLAADLKRFSDQMDFQQERLQGEVDRVSGILDTVLERLPSVDLIGSLAPQQRKSS